MNLRAFLSLLPLVARVVAVSPAVLSRQFCVPYDNGLSGGRIGSTEITVVYVVTTDIVVFPVIINTFVKQNTRLVFLGGVTISVVNAPTHLLTVATGTSTATNTATTTVRLPGDIDIFQTVNIINFPVTISTFVQQNTIIQGGGGVNIVINNAPTFILTTAIGTSTVTATVTSTIITNNSQPTPVSTSSRAQRTGFLLAPMAASVARRRVRRQATRQQFLAPSGGDSVENCNQASTFTIAEGRLLTDGNTFSTNEGVDSAPFVPSQVVGNISTTFTFTDRLTWSNAAFSGGEARFCSGIDGVTALFKANATVPGCATQNLLPIPAAACGEDGFITLSASSSSSTSVISSTSILSSTPTTTSNSESFSSLISTDVDTASSSVDASSTSATLSSQSSAQTITEQSSSAIASTSAGDISSALVTGASDTLSDTGSPSSTSAASVSNSASIDSISGSLPVTSSFSFSITGPSPIPFTGSSTPSLTTSSQISTQSSSTIATSASVSSSTISSTSPSPTPVEVVCSMITQVFDPDTNTCICVDGFEPDPAVTSFLSCIQIEFLCLGIGQVLDPDTNTCTCVDGFEADPNVDGFLSCLPFEVLCFDGLGQVLDPVTNTCVCVAGFEADPTVTGFLSCLPLEIQCFGLGQVLDPDTNTCTCVDGFEAGFTVDGFLSCHAPLPGCNAIGQTLDLATFTCICTIGFEADPTVTDFLSCRPLNIVCTAIGQVLDPDTNTCVCGAGFATDISFPGPLNCLSLLLCTSIGQVADPFTNTCICRDGFAPDFSAGVLSCFPVTVVCFSVGQVLDPDTNTCVCGDGFIPFLTSAGILSCRLICDLPNQEPNIYGETCVCKAGFETSIAADGVLSCRIPCDLPNQVSSPAGDACVCTTGFEPDPAAVEAGLDLTCRIACSIPGQGLNADGDACVCYEPYITITTTAGAFRCAAPQLIDGGFEATGRSPWNVFENRGDFGENSANFMDTSPPHSGLQALAVTLPGRGNLVIEQVMAVVPGKVYTLSYWTRQGLDIGGCYTYVDLFDATDNSYIVNLSLGTQAPLDWGLAQLGSWTGDSRAAIIFRMNFACFGYGNTLYTDEIIFE
ncbi:hypothetical protein VTL71DRAFT_14807 [Oculimacula yallundae]|uniref:DUF7908 domain-containing protein n=1 Tax=Oculimacula yallundae TaxID=86028 RepID=A0ABR4CKU3_9HELO